jgi:hypothetical protein
MVVSQLSQTGVAGSNCSHRGHVSFWVRRVKIANIDTSRGSLKVNLVLQALVHVPSAATQDQTRKPAAGSGLARRISRTDAGTTCFAAALRVVHSS